MLTRAAQRTVTASNMLSSMDCSPLVRTTASETLVPSGGRHTETNFERYGTNNGAITSLIRGQYEKAIGPNRKHVWRNTLLTSGNL